MDGKKKLTILSTLNFGEIILDGCEARGPLVEAECWFSNIKAWSHRSVSTRKALSSKQFDLHIYCCEAVHKDFPSWLSNVLGYANSLSLWRRIRQSQTISFVHGPMSRHTSHNPWAVLKVPIWGGFGALFGFCFDLYVILMFAILYYLDSQGQKSLCARKCIWRSHDQFYKLLESIANHHESSKSTLNEP